MSNRRRGFTILEILLVLAIIGALCALLFGVLGPAREKSRQSVCAANLHQWGKALSMYMQDWDGVEPSVGTPMTHAQIGLPPLGPPWIAFLKSYKLFGSPVTRCPSTHYMPGQAHSVSPKAVTYATPAMLSETYDPHYPEMVSHLGPRLPLVVCEMHNDRTDFEKQPSWAKKRVQTLRINQQVQFWQVPVHAASMQE